jgi:hypothetical protein
MLCGDPGAVSEALGRRPMTNGGVSARRARPIDVARADLAMLHVAQRSALVREHLFPQAPTCEQRNIAVATSPVALRVPASRVTERPGGSAVTDGEGADLLRTRAAPWQRDGRQQALAHAAVRFESL